MAERGEIRHAAPVPDDQFAVEDRRAAGKPGGAIHHAGVAVRPVETVAGKGPGTIVGDYNERAVAVVLDLVQPAVTGRRLGNELRDAGRNEGELRPFSGPV